jgi:hypothetical protein
MLWSRRAICLGLVLIGALGLIWASGVVFWLALGVVMVGLVGVLLPLAGGTDRVAPVALVLGSAFVGLALVESALWLWEMAISEPLPEFVAEAGVVPLMGPAGSLRSLPSGSCAPPASRSWTVKTSIAGTTERILA